MVAWGVFCWHWFVRDAIGNLFEMSDSVMFWIAIALLLFWAVGAYNRLVRCRSQGLVAFSVLAGFFNQHLLLVKTHAPDARDPGATPESDFDNSTALAAWAALCAAADQFKASLRVAHLQPLNAPAMGALKTAFETLCLSRQRVSELPVEEVEPVLVQGLTAQWEQVAVMAEGARADFNRAVQHYNAAISQFPALLLAWLFGFKPAQTL